MKYILILLFSSISIFASEKDSVYCFNKEQITKLATKIQTLRDSNDYLVAVVNVQDTVIDVYQSRSETFLKQLNNRDQVIDACQKRSKELEKINEELISIQDSRNTYEFKRYFLITQKKIILKLLLKWN